jgi:DnaJ-class molecular chaperone
MSPMEIEVVKYTVVIIEKLPDAFLVKCGFCNGSGEHPRKYQTCPVCDGHGRVLLKIPPDFNGDADLLKCAYCNGTGEHPRKYQTCPACKGVGVIVKCFPRVKCSYCNGSGEHPRRYELCPTCEGAGSVWVRRLKEY